MTLFALFFSGPSTAQSHSPGDFSDYPVYEGDDLGLKYEPTGSVFKLWSPVARGVSLHLYDRGTGGNRLETHALEKADDGVWSISIKRDLNGLYYTFQVETVNGKLDETPGIYAKATGVNGQRAAIIDLDTTDPEGWANDTRPALASPTDAILYELHLRDLTSHESSGSSFAGKYSGLVEPGTKSPAGEKTGIDHIVELGVTHVHILPAFDHRSINEERLDSAQFNWGYDPLNYNVPEGSYASDPYDPATRIREFKEMVKGFHDHGIRVILDVVYNHTGLTENSNFNLEVPDYYYRKNPDGTYSDASACGNETASEVPMMRKYILESVEYWAEEYHLDGFRFDLMGIHDIETMQHVARTLHDIDPTILVYGEGWTAGSSPLPESKLALKKNVRYMPGVAAFSDDLRDGIKGSVFNDLETGFVSGGAGLEETIKFGIVASTDHPQVDYSKVNYSKAPWAKDPGQTISYVSCHDNHTLYDKLHISLEGKASDAEIRKMHKMACAIVLTSQGIPFLHAGMEMMRTKDGEHNSYNKPDSINQIRWEWKTRHRDVFEYVQGLIALRKAHPAFRIRTSEDVRKYLRFFKDPGPGIVAYHLNGAAVGDIWSEIIVACNANDQAKTITIPEGTWKMAVGKGSVIHKDHPMISSGQQSIAAQDTWVLFRAL